MADTPTSTEKKEPRVSARINKGIPAKKFTFSESPEKEKETSATFAMKKEDLEQPLENPTPTKTPSSGKRAPSVNSRSSSKSVVLQKQEAVAAFKRHLVKLEQTRKELKKNQRATQAEVHKLERQLRPLHEKEEYTEEERKLKDELDERHETLNNILFDIGDELVVLERELDALQEEHEATKLKIEEDCDDDDEDDEDVDSVESSFGTAAQSVDDWVNNQVLHATPQAASTPIDQLTPPPPPPIQSTSESSKQSGSDIGKLAEMFSKVLETQQKDIVKATTGDKSLCEFDGSPKKWILFKEEFNRTTKEYKLSNSQNIIRLRKALKGPAESLVQHLLPFVNNVNLIMKSLEQRFGQPRFILESLREDVLKCPSPTIQNPESIINFNISVESLLSSMEALKDPRYLQSVELMDALVKKLPPDLSDQWLTWALTNDKQRSLTAFSEWLRIKATLAMELAPIPSPVKSESGNEEKKKGKQKRGPGAVNAAAGEAKDNKGSGIRCPLCNAKSHDLVDCRKFAAKSVSDRWKVIKDKKPKVCIGCLKVGHKSSECPTATDCKLGDATNPCKYRHHPMLHQSPRKAAPTQPQFPIHREETGGSINVTYTNGEVIVQGCDGPLPIIPIIIRGPKGIRKTYALLDTGASGTLILQELADGVGLIGEPFIFSFTTADGKRVTEEGATIVDAEVSGQFRNATFYPIRNAVTVSQMKMRPYSINMDLIKQRWPHLSKLKAKNLSNVTVEVIIGNKNPVLVLPQEIIKGGPEDPVAWRTPLGWTVSGELDGPRKPQRGSVNYIASTPVTNDYLHQLIKEHFSIENFGVVPNSRRGNNEMEAKAYKILESTTKKVGDRWETGLLWASDQVKLPSSYSMALQRLEYTEKNMRDPEFCKLYTDKINELRDKGFLVKVEEPTSTLDKESKHRIWHIPHFGVFNPNKPGKFRLVFDAAAKSNGVCLNDAFIKGPDLIRPLISVLWNFRRHKIALSGDICDMYYMVRVRKEDRPSQRCLWRDGDATRSPDIYEMVVLIMGGKSSPCIAIYIKNKNAEQFRDQFPEAVDAIIDDHYVDDCLTGGETDEDVIKLQQQISDINQSGGFLVRKWMSTSANVISSIPQELRADGVKEVGQDPTSFPVERVLGMWLDHGEDIFTFRLNLHKVSDDIIAGERPTKRNVCSLVMSLYDPLGFINHYKIKGIMILQRLWRAGIDWEDEIPTDVYEDWKKWLEILPNITQVKVPRWLGDLKDANEVTLHVFVDASEEAYAAVSYLVSDTGAGKTVAFLGSKTRVAPLKKLTIPRMELMAVLLGSRYGNTFQKEMKIKITRRIFWSDSQTVLSWIQSEARTFKEFVANRVGEIQEATNTIEWKWVPTNLNVADIATRYATEISFAPDDVWYKGPDFLYGNEKDWPKPKEKVTDAVINATATEIQWARNGRMITSRTEALKAISPEIERFSSFNRLLRASAAVEVAATIWLAKFRKTSYQQVWRKSEKGKIDRNYSKIQPSSLEKAEVRLVKLAQEEFYGDTMQQLRRDASTKPNKVAKRKKVRERNLIACDKIIKLLPFEKDGLLRVNGRLMNAKIPDEAKTPIILPSNHHLTALLIQKEHERCAHQGRETVLNNLRKKFWIVNGRQAVLAVTQSCGKCRLRRAHPIIPRMAPLPTHRLAAYQPAFTFTGLDYLGPFEVTVGRHHEKRWVALFTCLVTRGVHLEVAHGLTTDEAIMAISRFADTRGRPRVIHCDNGTNFVGAARALKKAECELNFDEISAHGKFQGIDWRFNPPAAPHCGGAWERLVRSVKTYLNSTLHAKFPHDTTFLTAIKGVEGILNSRPITHVFNDPSDPEALTPNHFLRGACDAGPPIPATPDEFDTYDALRARWKRAQLLTHQFWEQWTRDFLPKMMLREKWRETTEPIKLGELVFIVDYNQPRNTWIRGYVSKDYRGKDQQVRSVEITYKTNEDDIKLRRTMIVKRHVSGVCPLGISFKIQEDSPPKSGAGTVGESSSILEDDYVDDAEPQPLV